MKNSKKNVLKSFLFFCLGLTVTSIAYASVRVMHVPSRPGKPIASDVSPTGCQLNYEAPQSDGGAQIMVYVIEGMYVDGPYRWEDRGTSYTLAHSVDNMIEGKTAIFRIIARNKVGPSEPSKESNEITFENPF